MAKKIESTVDRAMRNSIMRSWCEAPERILSVTASRTSGSTRPPLDRRAISSSFKRSAREVRSRFPKAGGGTRNARCNSVELRQICARSNVSRSLRILHFRFRTCFCTPALAVRANSIIVFTTALHAFCARRAAGVDISAQNTM
jgi:hypothetical protein